MSARPALPAPAPAPRWYAVQTNPGKDGLAAFQLRRQGFAVFAPRLEKTIRHARQFRTVTVPLFPGYLFVALCLDHQRWRAINGTLGVRSLVMGGTRPLPVPDAVIEELQHSTAQSADRPHWRSGDAVKVVRGPLAGLLGRIERLEGNERVRVLMELIGGEVAVTLGRSAVAAG